MNPLNSNLAKLGGQEILGEIQMIEVIDASQIASKQFGILYCKYLIFIYLNSFYNRIYNSDI